MSRRYDLVILGGGTGGLVSAQIAAGMGARVALVERDARPGGDCLWTGCVPSKSLLAAAALVHDVRRAERFGLRASVEPVDLAAVLARVREIQEEIAPHDSAERLEAAGVEVVRGSGVLAPGSHVEVGGRRLRYRKLIVATGSKVAVPDLPGLDEAITTDTVWDLERLPASLVLLGGGAVGCELGQAFARLGSAVTIVEQADRLLPGEPPAAARMLAAALEEEGVTLRLGVGVEAADAAGLLLADGTRVDGERVLLATGRTPRTAGLGLEAAGVELDERGAIRVDGALRTTAKHVLAVGDVTGGLAFTHVAAHHARVATVNALLGLRRRADTAAIPRVTYTDPEVAHVGLTEEEARERWGEKAIVSSIAGHGQLDRARTARAPTPAATLVGDPRGRLVGATLVGHAAGEGIAEPTAWITAGAKLEALSTTVHAYPTFGEAPARAADEHVRERYASPRVRALLRPVLVAARALRRG